MAKTKTKPGPKPKYGEREEIHVLVPVDDVRYIRSVTDNMTEWIIQAIQEKRQRQNEEYLHEQRMEGRQRLVDSERLTNAYRRLHTRHGLARLRERPEADDAGTASPAQADSEQSSLH
jgi:hypothetical protein